MRLYSWQHLPSIVFELKMAKAAVVATDTLIALIAITPKVIYELKKRPLRKQLILFVSKIEQLGTNLPEDLTNLLQHYWPGPLTVVYKKTAYRMPKHFDLIALINLTGPLYSSSANLSGQLTLTDFSKIAKVFHKDIYRLIFVTSNPSLPSSSVASTIYDYDRKEILRLGEISQKQISRYVTVKNVWKTKGN